MYFLIRAGSSPPPSPARYPNWCNSKFEFCAKLIQFNIQFKIILGKFNSKDYSNLDKSLLFNSIYYSIYNKLLWFNSIYYSINNYCLWFNSKKLFKLGEKEVLKLVEYDEDIITAPQWVPIWRFWSQLGLFTVFGPHFYRLKSLISPYYMLFGKIQFRNDSLTILYQIQLKKNCSLFQTSTEISF